MESNLFLWILAGLLIGTATKLLLPAREPGGFVLSLLLGIAGALTGGMLQIAIVSASATTGLIGAIAGAALALTFYRIVMRARSR